MMDKELEFFISGHKVNSFRVILMFLNLLRTEFREFCFVTFDVFSKNKNTCKKQLIFERFIS